MKPLPIRHPPDMKRDFYGPFLFLGRPPDQSPSEKWISPDKRATGPGQTG
jgi:hypothetical protein